VWFVVKTRLPRALTSPNSPDQRIAAFRAGQIFDAIDKNAVILRRKLPGFPNNFLRCKDMFSNSLLTGMAENWRKVSQRSPEGAQVVLFRLRPYLPTALIALVLTYVCVQYLTGEKGFFSQESRDRDLAVKEKQLAQLKAEHADLEARAKYLRADNLSKDLLEERARLLLGLAEPKAYVIRYNSDPQANS
jgi:cell division protein FtsB